VLRKRVLDLLKSLLVRETASADAGSELRIAAAALLLDAASMDDHIEEVERAAIEGILIRQFGLGPAQARQLIATASAAQAESTQLLRFTRVVKDTMPLEDREKLMEWLWEVVYADGIEHNLEANLMRRIAGLIYVDDKSSGAARKRVRRRLGLDD